MFAGVVLVLSRVFWGSLGRFDAQATRVFVVLGAVVGLRTKVCFTLAARRGAGTDVGSSVPTRRDRWVWV